MQVSTECTIFKHERRESTRSKTVQVLCRSDIVFGAIQTVRQGGETNLHSHDRLDGFWFVLSGRARFYTTDDVVIADLGPRDGILIPRDYPYWFERVGDEELELLQVEASTVALERLSDFGDKRKDYAPRHSGELHSDTEVIVPEGEETVGH